MSSDFELKRLTDKLKELRQEQERITYSLMSARREEQLEIDRVQREFRIKISQLEMRHEGIIHDIRNCERDLENKQRQIKKALTGNDDSRSVSGRYPGRSAYNHLA